MEKNKILDFFADYIFKQLGIVYKSENYYQLETRLNDIVKQLEYGSIEDFYREALGGLSGNPKQLLLDIATNNETLFFRDSRVFDSLGAHIDSIIADESRKVPLRIWSTASSTGQEPYSLAMLLADRLDRLPGKTFRILATDISQRVLERARSGEYGQLEVQRGLPAMKLATYFEASSNDMDKDPKWRVKSDLKMHVEFKTQNLIEPFSNIEAFDIILCRNVLIYQEAEAKKEIIERLHEHLKPDGILVLGGAESLMGITDKFTMHQIAGSVFYKKSDANRLAS